jgi:hypothetical protein
MTTNARTLVAVLLTSGALLAVPASGTAAVTIGSNLTNAGAATNIGACTSLACSYTQVAPLPAGDVASGGLASPIDGVVTRWRIKSGSAGSPVKLRVMRPTGGGAFTGVESSATETTANGTSGSFATALAIEKGDQLGADNATDALIFETVPGSSIYYWKPPLVDGSTQTASGTQGSAELMVQADVEPDVDCDGRGDETQDTNTTDGPCAKKTPPAAPAISALSVSPRTFKAKRGTRFRYTLSEAARVSFTIARRTTGRVVGSSCRKTIRANRKNRHCARFVRVGSLTQAGRAGANTKRFFGRLRGRRVAPGSYRATLVATDAAGSRSRPARVGFRVARG